MIETQTIGNATLYRGDALEILRQLEPNSCDALVTDPPYSSGGLHIGTRQQQPSLKYVSTGTTAAHNVDFHGDNRDGRSWTFWSMLWLSLANPLIRPGGYAMMFTDWRQLPASSDAFQGGGFTWRGIVPWDKTLSSRAPHTGYFRHQCEYVLWGSRGPLPKCTHGGPWPGMFSHRVIPSEKWHMTGKPIGLMADLISPIGPGKIILDPFMGSASTGVAALQSGCEFVGIESSISIFDTACARLEQLQATLHG
ncbi:DNA methyltransferase [Serratia fonticola]|uniref:DNA-methyltransferase n=1 Tax=Serratia fonticola TaxID=47917 RepID=UPI003AACCA4A